MKWQIWEFIDEDGDPAQTCFPAQDFEKHAWGWEGQEPKMVHEFEANTWNEAGQKRYDFYGWGEYHSPQGWDGDKPFEEQS